MDTDTSMNGQKDTLKVFLAEEIDSIRTRLGVLKGRLSEDDFHSLETELNERSETLESLTDEDDTQLFILRREIGTLQEDVEALAVRRGWWSRLPFSVKVAIFTLPVILYLIWFSLVQWRNQGQIYNYAATQTAVAAQATASSIPVTPAFTPTPIP